VIFDCFVATISVRLRRVKHLCLHKREIISLRVDDGRGQQRGARGKLPTELDELCSCAAEELNDGWTVLCGFEYCAENRFFGMEEICGVDGCVTRGWTRLTFITWNLISTLLSPSVCLDVQTRRRL
jgi:hypothetical protein